MAHAPDVYEECRHLFVTRGLSPTQIAAVMHGSPSRATISGWSNEVDEHGKTWHDYRAADADGRIEQVTPRALAEKILRQINTILDGDQIDSKGADALRKLQSAMMDLAGPAFMVPAMYEVLTDLVLYLRQHAPHLLTDDFVGAMRLFKTTLRGRLDAPARRIVNGT